MALATDQLLFLLKATENVPMVLIATAVAAICLTLNFRYAAQSAPIRAEQRYGAERLVSARQLLCRWCASLLVPVRTRTE